MCFYVSECSKSFTNINVFNPHKISEIVIIIIPIYTDKQLRHTDVMYFFQKNKVIGRTKMHAPNYKLIMPLNL